MNNAKETKSRSSKASAAAVVKEIRAIYQHPSDSGSAEAPSSATTPTIRVYQAYNHAIADAAVAAQSFRGPLEQGLWSDTRRTWIKPSKAWMAYRCGFTVLKDENQSRVLALDVSQTALEDLLAKALVNHSSEDASNKAEASNKPRRSSSVVVQWDPERILTTQKGTNKQAYTKPVPSVRSIQIGLRGLAVHEFLLNPRAVVRITDVTQDFVTALEALRAGDLAGAHSLLWPTDQERLWEGLSEATRRGLGMNISSGPS